MSADADGKGAKVRQEEAIVLLKSVLVLVVLFFCAWFCFLSFILHMGSVW